MSTSATTSFLLRPLEHSNLDEDGTRLRVSKACNRCRTRKDRCDGMRPSCTPCQAAKKPCSYEATTKKRGLPEGYVRGLEKLTTLACQTVDGLEDILLDYLQNAEVQKTWNSAVGDELWTNWKDGRVYQQLDEFLQTTSTTGTKRKRTGEETSSESPEEVAQLNLKKCRIIDGYAISGREDVQGGTVDQALQQLPANSKDLIDLYFTHVHCWFPVLDRPSVLKAFYGHSRPGQKKLDGSQALLWAIFAYAVNIADVEAKETLSQQYSETALKHIPTPYTNAEDVQDFDIMQAQALIVLSLLRLGNGQWLGAWMCTGRAARILLATNAEIKLRKGSLQGCFILESLLNVHFENSQPLFPQSLINDMIDEDGHEEWESWSSIAGPSFALSIFNRLTRVFLILHDAITNAAVACDPAYVRLQLTSVHDLAQEHFASGVGNPNTESPPHHVYFQIGLLFAQLKLVARLIDKEGFDVASLAANVLGLCEICEKSAYIGLEKVPPLFADILNLAINVGPAYKATILDFRSRLTAVWKSFQSNRPESQPEVEFVAPTWTPIPSRASAPSMSQLWPFPGTSPSFAGDEVDAIFHEMAHLDTNEWSTERAIGLRDFGFTDETAFMDFCNDPERLAMPVENGMPLSSTRQSWTFAAPDQGVG